jgi:hypothetical protein
MMLLREYFPADETGHCEIEHYCYVLVFGKNGEAYETPEELYDRLVLGKTSDALNKVFLENSMLIHSKLCTKNCGKNGIFECRNRILNKNPSS